MCVYIYIYIYIYTYIHLEGRASAGGCLHRGPSSLARGRRQGEKEALATCRSAL